jgi:Resolvase, N terminal domain
VDARLADAIARVLELALEEVLNPIVDEHDRQRTQQALQDLVAGWTRPRDVMRAALYARVSTFDQEPENQLQELRRHTTARGWTDGRDYSVGRKPKSVPCWK